MTRSRFLPRLVRSYQHTRLMAAIHSHRINLRDGDPKKVATTRRELVGAVTCPQDRSLAALALA